MKCQLVVCLAVLAVSNSLPTNFRGPPNLQHFFGQPSTATGTSNAGITGGTQAGPGGLSTITSSNAQTGGQASGNGQNVGTASANQGNFAGLLGSKQFANVDTTSVQNTQGNFPGFPTFPNFGTATGGASSALQSGKTVGPGGVSKVTSLTASAGGSASNGGSSTNAASGSNQSTEGILGSSEQSSNNAVSVQTGR